MKLFFVSLEKLLLDNWRRLPSHFSVRLVRSNSSSLDCQYALLFPKLLFISFLFASLPQFELIPVKCLFLATNLASLSLDVFGKAKLRTRMHQQRILFRLSL